MTHSAPETPIAIVALGALTPGAEGVEEFWRLVVEGRDLMTEVPRDRWLVEDYHDPDPTVPDKTYARRGAFLPDVDFDPMEFGIPPSMLRSTDTAQLLALVVAKQVLGGVDTTAIDRDRIGVVLGAAALDLIPHTASRLQRPILHKVLLESGLTEQRAESICDRVADLAPAWNENTFPGGLTNVIAGRIANKFDLHGMNHTTDAACASSFAALSTAVAELRLGRADLMITGGVDTLNDIGTFLCFSKTPALSFSGDCRPFSDRADGTMLGEGLAMFALKRLADAERDGDRIHAVIRGIGTSSDGRSTSIYAPLAEGQQRALRRAYDEAGYGPESVELVEAHGTGTQAGDAAEVAALRAVFDAAGRSDRQWCALGSVKSQIGHTKCAAGAIGLLKAVLALQHRVLPPTIKVDRPNPELELDDSPFYLNTELRPWARPAGHPRRASVSSFGFGGSNFHVTLEEHVRPGRVEVGYRTAPSELVLLSAATPDALVSSARSLDRSRPLAESARHSQQQFRSADPVRLAVVAADTEQLGRALDSATELIGKRPQDAFSTPTGAHYGVGTSQAGRIGFLFPGQGSQYVGMCGDLVAGLPAAQAAWNRLDIGADLNRMMFPPPAFDDLERAEQTRRLTATEWAQPALAAHSVTLLDVLRQVGLRPDCVAGHSFGELVALHAAGAFGPDDLLRLARRRGEVLRDAARTPGGMLAITGPPEAVTAVLDSCAGLPLWVANHNSPEQLVVSGTGEAIGVLADELAAAGIAATRLNTATAFHSPLVAAAEEPLREFLESISVKPPEIDVFGNADAARYPSEADRVRNAVASQVVRPVRFSDVVEAMYAANVRTFVEVGPGSVLTGLVGRILQDREHLAVSTDRRGRGHGSTGLHEALARLAVHGVELDLDALWSGSAPPAERAARPAPKMTVQLNGGNHGRPYPPADGSGRLPQRDDTSAKAAERAARLASVARGLDVDVPSAAAHEVPAPIPPVQDTPRAAGDWLGVVGEMQRQIAQAHADYQRMFTETHLAFLKSSEDALSAFTGTRVQSAPTAIIASELPSAPELPATVQRDVPAPEPAGLGTLAAAISGGDLAPEDVEAALLSIVAEATGYPLDILDVDMEIEADLGIDSIAKVEIFAAFREQVGELPSVDLAEWAGLRTLREIAAKLHDHVGSPPGTATEPASVLRLAARTREARGPGSALRQLFDEPVVVTDDASGVAPALVEGLRENGIGAVVADEVPPHANRVIFLDGLTASSEVTELLDVQRRVFTAVRRMSNAMPESGGLLVSVQDTGGDLGTSAGYRGWLGGLAGLARTAAKEWPATPVKVIDCARGDRDARAVAAAILEELLTGGDEPDVGLREDGTRTVPALVPAPVEPAPDEHRINPGSVIVATGGARGVTAAALRALAAEHQPHLVLLGRTPLTDGDTDRDTAVREIRNSLAAFEAAGSKVWYLAVDVRDETAVREALEQVRDAWGPITGIVHGAGALADGLLRDKTDEHFTSVFDTKVVGLRNLLAATEGDPLEVICLFSSVSGCFGNRGQSDYAMANEVLNHLAPALRADRPQCLVRSIAWGPWQGGMVTDAVAQHFAAAGVSSMSLEDGAAAFVAELTGSTAETRVVLATGSALAAFGADPGESSK